RQHLFTRQPGPAKVGVGALTNLRQRLRKDHQSSVLDLVADLAPLRVIAILLPPARIAARRLEMAARIGANPHVGPRGRDHERADARQHGGVADAAAVLVDIAETAARANTADAGTAVIADVTQTGDFRRVRRRHRRMGTNERTDLAHRGLTMPLVGSEL